MVAGSVPALVLPGNPNTVITQQNKDAQIRWSSNAKFFGNGGPFNYTIELFDGNHTQAQLTGKTPIYTVTAASDKNNVIIPGEELATLSVDNNPAYTFRISMPHPIATGEVLAVVGYIVVKPEPAIAHIESPADGLYMLDNKNTEIKWSVENYANSETVGTFRIDRISTENGSDVTAIVYSENITAASGSYSMTPSPVNGLKDTDRKSTRLNSSH